MAEAHERVGDKLADATAPELTDTDAEVTDAHEDVSGPAPQVDPSLMDEVSTLIDDARTYVEAELGFQKTRAAFAGRLIGVAAGLGIVALILLHIAFLALAVGLVIAFEPVVGIWGAIALVFGGLLILVAFLGWRVFANVKRLAGLFGSSDQEETAQQQDDAP
ncbi:phage holin family protein [Erythrobacter sp. SCSIO 43205]|uniref:phage holin family protein n=1 Tax=Erythrobacter sp. SCSIO 43205 TaxID=2779361 RepID=UPI001CAA09EF|nr:phage holin family protein [Erythrobacter sp. SCSIO 43205]UAB77094.1 phage holin family protein [Erythrobacter sp. SCSIO 43205]